MAKGGKGKGKKDKKAQLPVVPTMPEDVKDALTEVERTFFDLQIADIKRKILRLRAHIQNLDVVNAGLATEIQSVKVEKNDEAGELTNKVEEIHDNILKIKSENAQLTEAYHDEKRRSDETIIDLERKYKAMHDQLSSDIKRLNGKLNACEEFRLNRDNWLVKFNERADELTDKEMEAKEVLRQMEAKSVYERELLKDEMLNKLTLAGEEFTGAGSTSSSDLNLRLIRENIALQKNIDMLVNSNDEMDLHIQQESELYASNKAGIPELEKRNRALIKESQDKLNIIKHVSAQVEKLRQEFIAGLSYREQNIGIKEFQICARFRRRKLQKLVSHVGQKINSMENEVDLYDYLIEQYQNEREKIEHHLENLRLIIERSIGMTNVQQFEHLITLTLNESAGISFHYRDTLLNQLVGLLETDFDFLDTGRRASLATLKPYERLTRFEELFKKEAPSLTSLMDLCAAYIESDADELESTKSSALTIAIKRDIPYEAREYETILPGQRPFGRNYIFDVESGTSLYYSSELEDPERMEPQEEGAPDDDAEEESSSEESVKKADSGDEAPPKKKPEETEKSKKPETVATTVEAASEKSGASKLPPGTIIDVVTDEGDEEEEYPKSTYEGEETLDEDEEYDINLFY